MNNVLEVTGLTKEFPARRRNGSTVHAVNGVDLTIARGETLALVGESGCGKSTLGRSVIRLIEPTAGAIRVNGVDLTSLTPAQLRDFRQHIQIIFQDPYASLDPRWTIEQTLSEPLRTYNNLNRAQVAARVSEMLTLVGLADYHRHRFPHEFSGGQRQRVAIARALILNPDLLICDEPLSALDVSVQAQIVNLMRRLQRSMHTAYLFISHDLSVVRFIADRVAVLYLGRIVEYADTDTLFRAPKHPYTKSLLSAVPEADPSKRSKRIVLQGEPPSPTQLPVGCAFASRCPISIDRCLIERPELRRLKNGADVACHRAE